MRKICLFGGFLLASLVSLTGFSSSGYSANSKLCPGEEGYYFTNKRKTNPTKGGFVSNGAFVDEYAFIAPSAAVCGSATVEGGARIMGNAIIKGEAMINANVRVMGNAIVGGSAEVYNDRNNPTLIKGYARIFSGIIEGGRHGDNKLPADIVNAQNAKKEKTELQRTMKKIILDGLNEYKRTWDDYDSPNYPQDRMEIKTVRWGINEKCELSVSNYYYFDYYSRRGTSYVSKGWNQNTSYRQVIDKAKLKGLKIKIDDKGQMFFFDDLDQPKKIVKMEKESTRISGWRGKRKNRLFLLHIPKGEKGDYSLFPPYEKQPVNYSARRTFAKAFKRYAETYCGAKVSI